MNKFREKFKKVDSAMILKYLIGHNAVLGIIEIYFRNTK